MWTCGRHYVHVNIFLYYKWTSYLYLNIFMSLSIHNMWTAYLHVGIIHTWTSDLRVDIFMYTFMYTYEGVRSSHGNIHVYPCVYFDVRCSHGHSYVYIHKCVDITRSHGHIHDWYKVYSRPIRTQTYVFIEEVTHTGE